MIPWKGALLDALALVSPVTCAGCGALDRALCLRCRGALAPRIRVDTLASGAPLVTGLDYDGVARSAILMFKEHGRTDIATFLAAPLRAAVLHARREGLASGGGAVRIVPVPTSRAALRRRGVDPVALLVRAAGIRGDRALAHAHSARTQKTLSAEARSENRRGSLRARVDVRGARVVVVDDVVTTGATLLEATRALTAAGALVVCALAVARTPLRRLPEQSFGELRDDIVGLQGYGEAKGAFKPPGNRAAREELGGRRGHFHHRTQPGSHRPFP